ncbi:Uncharacterised protein [Mycobacteroides abscessus subsp. massiliense]|nr:Uncharacterised protein [Mycobacteroides abscessus subsp. massiliense]
MIHRRARSSRALAQRSSNTTAFLPSKLGATKRGQSEPNSAETSSMSSVSVAPSEVAIGADRPSWSSTRRAAEARTPSRPVIWSVNSLSAAASTVAPPPPPAEGRDTPTPRRAATAATPASIAASTALPSASVLGARPPRSPPRTLVPSRVPSANSTVTCLTQPGPSSQVLVIRSAMAAGRLPEGPKTVLS